MLITTEKIKALKPCRYRFDNFETNYPNYSGSLIEFLALENITYSDKVWVFVRLADHLQNVQWSVYCAESVLHNFEKLYPDDKRPRLAIEVSQAFILNPNKESAAWSAAWSAAESAWSAAWSAAESTWSDESARSAAWSAAWSDESARSAAWSAARSAARSAAESAAESAESTWYARSAESAESTWSARSAARSAWFAARSARSEKEQEILNLQFMLLAIKEIKP